MSKEDTETTLQELKELVAKLCDERNWSSQHTPKNLAISIALEYEWLREHATEFDFCESYPEDNPYGVMPESWHWRYQGETI